MDKQLVPITMRRVYEHGLTTLSGGNLSMREGDAIWITPSGIDKGQLSPDDVVCIKADATVEGRYRPSSEYPFHQAIYSARDDVKVILHAHSPALVAYCIAHKVPDTRIIKDAFASCGEIGYADYVMPGSPQLGEKLATVFSEGYDVVLMENHGVVISGDTFSEVMARLIYASFIATVTMNASSLAVPIPLDNLSRYKWTIPETESDPETELEPYYIRGVKGGIFHAGMATFYAHSDDAIITYPQSQSDLLKNLLSPEKPYLIEAQSPYLMGFAVTHSSLDTRTIPEAYATLHNVPLVDDNAAAIESALIRHDAIVIKNRGVIVTGDSALHAYDRLEVLEYTARSAIEAARIGGVVPMSEQAIRDLDEGYHRYYKGLSG